MRVLAWTVTAFLLVGVSLSTAAAITGYGPDFVKGFSGSLLKH